VALFSSNLADHTTILTPLTTKVVKHVFPDWTTDHQHAFETIKAIVVSRECLTVIDLETWAKTRCL